MNNYLYTLPETIRTFESEYNAEETTDERRLELESELLSLSDNFNGLVEHLCVLTVENEAEAEYLSPEIKRLSERKDRSLRRSERMERLIDNLMQRSGLKELKTGLFKVNYRKSEAVIVTDESLLPGQFTKTTVTADKTTIKKALKEGQEVPGAFIEKRENLQIK